MTKLKKYLPLNNLKSTRRLHKNYIRQNLPVINLRLHLLINLCIKSREKHGSCSLLASTFNYIYVLSVFITVVRVVSLLELPRNKATSKMINTTPPTTHTHG